MMDRPTSTWPGTTAGPCAGAGGSAFWKPVVPSAAPAALFCAGAAAARLSAAGALLVPPELEQLVRPMPSAALAASPALATSPTTSRRVPPQVAGRPRRAGVLCTVSICPSRVRGVSGTLRGAVPVPADCGNDAADEVHPLLCPPG